MKEINLSDDLITSLDALLEDDFFEVSILANTSALLNQYLENINWVGFYLLYNDYLFLGPFQGKVACTKIKVGNGVCGTAVSRKEIIVVKDVHEFPGHIACDAESNSEIVLPIFVDEKIYGVLDIDSPLIGRFSESDKKLLEKVVGVISKHLKKINVNL